MKILVVGGGSGGHVTPAVAVVREILKQKPRAEVEFWTDFKYYKYNAVCTIYINSYDGLYDYFLCNII